MKGPKIRVAARGVHVIRFPPRWRQARILAWIRSHGPRVAAAAALEWDAPEFVLRVSSDVDLLRFLVAFAEVSADGAER